VGDSTSRVFRRHLHRPLNRFVKFSRQSTPQGSLPAFASGDVAGVGATRIRPITGRHSLFPTPIPAYPRLTLRSSYLLWGRSTTGLPRSARLIVWPAVETRPVVPSVVSYEVRQQGNALSNALGQDTHSHPTGTRTARPWCICQHQAEMGSDGWYGEHM
jgi:hypothetical protein